MCVLVCCHLRSKLTLELKRKVPSALGLGEAMHLRLIQVSNAQLVL